MLAEVDEQLATEDHVADLVAVPVGVGSLAEAVVRHYRQPAGPHPRVLSVERHGCVRGHQPRPR